MRVAVSRNFFATQNDKIAADSDTYMRRQKSRSCDGEGVLLVDVSWFTEIILSSAVSTDDDRQIMLICIQTYFNTYIV